MQSIHIDCLLVAVLTAQRYSLEKAWALRDALHKARLNDPERVSHVHFENNNMTTTRPHILSVSERILGLGAPRL